MPDLTPLDARTEGLTPTPDGAQTLSPSASTDQTLSRLGEQEYGFEFLLPSVTTYPGATTYPGTYGTEIGVRLVALPEGDQTLTPLTEA